MLYCLNDDPKTRFNMIPVSGLKKKKLFEEDYAVNKSVEEAGSEVKPIMRNGNCVNQAFFTCLKLLQMKLG